MEVGDKVKFLGIYNLYASELEFTDDMEEVEGDGLKINQTYIIRYTVGNGRDTQWLMFKNHFRTHDSAFFRKIKRKPSLWNLE